MPLHCENILSGSSGLLDSSNASIISDWWWSTPISPPCRSAFRAFILQLPKASTSQGLACYLANRRTGKRTRQRANVQMRQRANVPTFQRAKVLRRRRAEPCQDVATIGFIKVAPGSTNQRRASCPAPAAQHLVIAKPWNRIFLVGIYHEAGIGPEIIGGPFPGIADHLPASKHAVACRKSTDRYASHRPPIQAGLLRRRGVVPPRAPGLGFPSARAGAKLTRGHW